MAEAAYFGFTLDRPNRIMSAFGGAILAGAPFLLLMLAWLAPTTAAKIGLTACAFATGLLAIILCWYIPRRLALTDDAVVIERPNGPVRIPYTNIHSARIVHLTWIMRVCGVGGFFGSWGWFTSRQIKWFRGYIKRAGPMICLDLVRGSAVILSPDDPELFRAELLDRLPVGQSGALSPSTEQG